MGTREVMKNRYRQLRYRKDGGSNTVEGSIAFDADTLLRELVTEMCIRWKDPIAVELRILW